MCSMRYIETSRSHVWGGRGDGLGARGVADGLWEWDEECVWDGVAGVRMCGGEGVWKDGELG